MTILAIDPQDRQTQKQLVCQQLMQAEPAPTQHARKSGRYGIITALSENMMIDFMIMYQSLRRHGNYTVNVVNLGLTVESIDKLHNIGVFIKWISPDELKHMQSLHEHWRQWYKPYFLMTMTDYDYVLWLDTDVVILDSLEPLFASVNDSFFVVIDYFDPVYCRNDPNLYVHYPIDIKPEEDKIALNSGVIGYSPHRDKVILDEWMNTVKLATKDARLLNWIHLFDQGALLYALHKLNMIDKIVPYKTWNTPARKNPYQFDLGDGDYKWPHKDDTLGGNIIDYIKSDNEGVVIAHFAGLPKLSHLCQIDHPYTMKMRNAKHGHTPTIRIFVIGLERAGTHTIAESVKRSSIVESWVRHEPRPSLSRLAKLKHENQFKDDGSLETKMKCLGRNDVPLVMESNHRLAFFIPELANLENSRFILMLRNPINLIKSRLRNFAIWKQVLYKYPGCYQNDVYHLPRTFGRGSPDQNEYRIAPQDISNLDIIDLHIWEVRETIRTILNDLDKIDYKNKCIIDIENLNSHCDTLIKFIGPQYINKFTFKDSIKKKHGVAIEGTISKESVQWIEDITRERRNDISRLYDGLFNTRSVKIVV